MRHKVWLRGLALLPALPGSCRASRLEHDTVRVGDLQRAYSVQYPSGTAPAVGWPLVLAFHGWQSSGSEMAAYDGLRLLGASSAIVAHGEGHSDPTDPGWLPRDRWKSWNGAGSAGAEPGGVDGPTCEPAVVADGGWQCYESCRDRGYCTAKGVGAERCRWSHCEDDVAFVLAMVGRIKSRAAVDASRVYATGHSNGALFVYELASDPRSAGVFAAIAPVSGLPHNGFNRGTPNARMRFLDIGGSQDTFVWHFPNVAADGGKSYGACCGWYYSNWRNTTSLWAAQKGLRDSGRAELGSRHGLACQGWSPDGTAESADVGFCTYRGGHQSPAAAWKLAWDFFGLPVSERKRSGALGQSFLQRATRVAEARRY